MRISCNMLVGFLLAVAWRAAADSALLYTPHVHVADFQAALRKDGQVVVQWRTTVELGVDAFQVLRQADDAGTMPAAGRVAAYGDESGHAYTLTDGSAVAGTRRHYVLQLVSRSRPNTNVADWDGLLQPVVSPVSAAQKMVSSAQIAPQSGTPALRQSWIGNGSRVLAWTNALPADRVRLSLRDTGVYGLNAGELALASGWKAADIVQAMATTNLCMTSQGLPVAWHAEGSNLFFYGVPPQSRFAPENVYWVSLGPGSNMAPLSLPPGDPATTNATFISQIQHQGTDYLARVTHSSLASIPVPYTAFNPLLTSGGSSLLENDWLVDCATGTWTGTVTVNLLSYYEGNAGTDTHAARIWIGGADVGEPAWTGEQYLSCAYPFASTNLAAGVAALQINNSGVYEFICISCAYSYPRRYQAENGVLQCTGGACNTVAVAGFATNDLLVLDVTAANLPCVVEPVALACDAVSGNWTASLPCGGTDCLYQVVSKSAGVLQPAIRGVCDVDWTSPTQAADYVILVPPEGWRNDIRPVLQPLADFRNAQGLRTVIVDVESLYNQFSCGLVDPQAIHTFCCAGYTNWPQHQLKYVLLAGAGCLDFQHLRLSVNDYTACLIPTIIAGQQFPTEGEGMTIALDEALGSVPGNAAPEVAIGRLPTTSTQAMATVVQKTMAYEGAQLWKQQAVVAADWDNTGTQYYPFSVGADLLIPPLLATGRTVVKSYYNLYPDSGDPGDMLPTQMDSLFPAFASGTGLFHFFGHTADQELGGGDYDLLDMDGYYDQNDISSANWTKPMIAVVIGCRVNRWQSLTTTVPILPYGVLAPGTGFVAALGATGYQLEGEGQDLGVALYAQAAINGTLRLGDVLKNGLQQMAGEMPSERLQSFSLTGDPALVFRPDITAMGTPVTWLAQCGLTAPNADLAAGSDGWPIWRECLAGATPTNYVLRVTSASPLAQTDRMALGFEATATNTYQIQYKQSLLATDNWQAVSWSSNATDGTWLTAPILPQGPVTTVAVPMTNASSSGFYRLIRLD
jgi:hypothetical protein